MGSKRAEYISLLVATTALLLSQFKPMHEYFKSPNVKVEINDTVQVGHFLGELIFQPYIKISNIGEDTGHLVKIHTLIVSDDLNRYKKELADTSFYSDATTAGIDNQPTVMPFTGLDIKPDDSFSRYFIFRNDSSTSQDRFFINNLQSELVNEIGPYNPYLVRESSVISDQLFDKIYDFTTNRMNGFIPGDYYFVVIVWTSDAKDPSEIYFKFNISHEDAKSLNEISKRYRFAEGLIRPATMQVLIPINLLKVSNEQAQNIHNYIASQ
ncbi:hypothetical protein [Photobacterium sp. R1]